MTTGVGMRPGLLDAAVTVRVGFALVRPEAMPVSATVCEPASSLSERLPSAVRLGVWFPALLTVTTKVSVAELVPSLTTTVIVAAPVRLSAGVTRTVRLAPEPPKTMALLGTRVGLEEVPARVRLAAGVSASPTVKGTRLVAVFCVMV